jgi:1,2-diacylglycerol 3-alpha-glucosyltransferase
LPHPVNVDWSVKRHALPRPVGRGRALPGEGPLGDMRIGIVTATYAPSRNGVATSTALFVRGLRALGHTVRVFAPRHPAADPEPDVIRLPGLQVGVPPDYPLLLPVGPVASGMLPIRDFDLIHTMHPFVAGHIAQSWARRIGVPLVFTAHTQYHEYVRYSPTPAGLTLWAVKRHVRAFAQQADLVLAPGEAMVEVLRGYGYRGAVELMPNPVDLSEYDGARDPELRGRHGVPADAPLLVYVGRMGPEKGLPRLLEAFTAARRAEPRLHLLMVGDGPLRTSLAATSDPQVHWVGPVPHDRVAAYLCESDLFVSASVTEVQPMTFLESLAAGTPVVAVESAAARELLRPGENGDVSAADASDLAERIVRALRRDDPETLRQGARDTAAKFDVAERAAALAAAYARAVPRRLRPRGRGRPAGLP